MARRRYTHYGVRVGRRTGVFTDWSDCAEQVSGYSGQCYHGFYSYEEAFDFAYGERRAEREGSEQPDHPPQLAAGHTPEAAIDLEDVFDSELETAMTTEPTTVTAPEPTTVAELEPEAAATPEPATAAAPEPSTVTESETETVTQPTTAPNAEPGPQEQPPAKKARHTQGQATETFSDTQENTFSSDDIVDEAGESSSSAADSSETVYNDIGQAQERLLALMEGGGAVKIVPVPSKRKREE